MHVVFLIVFFAFPTNLIVLGFFEPYKTSDDLKNTLALLQNLISYPFLKCGYPTNYWTTPQIAKRDGYYVQSHEMWTEDGYKLTMHRIPSNGPAVLLQHGIYLSSNSWVINGNQSLAYIMSDRGYDVWLGNSRGTAYSRLHKKYSLIDQKFWNFSFYERGIFDLPAEISYITNLKNDSLLYIGYSMGTTMFYALASEFPEKVVNVKAAISLAPVAFLGHLTNPVLRSLSPYYQMYLQAFLGEGAHAPWLQVFEFLYYHIAKILEFVKEWAPRIYELGFRADLLENMGLTDEMLIALVDVPSIKDWVHYAQHVQNPGTFRKFNFGNIKNLKVYNNEDPPEFNLTNIKVPICLTYGLSDLVSNTTDVKIFSEVLSVKLPPIKIKNKNFGHGDYLWGSDPYISVFKPMLKIIDKYVNKN